MYGRRVAGRRSLGGRPSALQGTAVRYEGKPAVTATATAVAGTVVDRAWRLLDANHAAIDRADAKAGMVVAACGVSAAALVSVYGAHHAGAAANSSALFCAALALASTSSAGLALRPRRMRAQQPDSLIYFDHVTRMAGSSAERYLQSARSLFADEEALAIEITRQVWITAHLATVKYDWINRAVVLLFGNLLALGLTALLLVV